MKKRCCDVKEEIEGTSGQRKYLGKGKSDEGFGKFNKRIAFIYLHMTYGTGRERLLEVPAHGYANELYIVAAIWFMLLPQCSFTRR